MFLQIWSYCDIGREFRNIIFLIKSSSTSRSKFTEFWIANCNEKFFKKNLKNLISKLDSSRLLEKQIEWIQRNSHKMVFTTFSFYDAIVLFSLLEKSEKTYKLRGPLVHTYQLKTISVEKFIRIKQCKRLNKVGLGLVHIFYNGPTQPLFV